MILFGFYVEEKSLKTFFETISEIQTLPGYLITLRDSRTLFSGEMMGLQLHFLKEVFVS